MQQLEAEERQQRQQQLLEGIPLGPRDEKSCRRAAISRALVAHGLLSFRRRRITLAINRAVLSTVCGGHRSCSASSFGTTKVKVDYNNLIAVRLLSVVLIFCVNILVCAEDADTLTPDQIRKLAVQFRDCDDYHTRLTVLFKLEHARAFEPSAAKILIDSLSNPDAAIKEYASRTLSNMAPDIVPLLINSLGQSDNEDFKVECLRALSLCKVAELLADRDKDQLLKVLMTYWRTRGDAGHWARATIITFGDLAVSSLIQSLNSKSQEEQLDSIRMLGSIGKKAMRALPYLETLAESEQQASPELFSAALVAIRQIGSISDHGLQLVTQSIASADYRISNAAIDLLVSLGEQAVDPTIAVIENPNLSLDARRSGIYILKKLGARAEHSVPSLTKLLADKNFVREAARALGAIGKKAESASLELFKTMATQNGGTIPILQEALSSIGTDNISTLTEALQIDNKNVRLFALFMLGSKRQKALPAKEEIRRFAKCEDEELVRAAIDALKKIETTPGKQY